jgi:hypothetical protein
MKHLKLFEKFEGIELLKSYNNITFYDNYIDIYLSKFNETDISQISRIIKGYIVEFYDYYNRKYKGTINYISYFDDPNKYIIIFMYDKHSIINLDKPLRIYTLETDIKKYNL